MMTSIGNFVTTEQAAIMRGVSRSTIFKWIHNGHIIAHPIGEGRRKQWLIDRQSLMKFQPAPAHRPTKQSEEK